MEIEAVLKLLINEKTLMNQDYLRKIARKKLEMNCSAFQQGRAFI